MCENEIELYVNECDKWDSSMFWLFVQVFDDDDDANVCDPNKYYGTLMVFCLCMIFVPLMPQVFFPTLEASKRADVITPGCV